MMRIYKITNTTNGKSYIGLESTTTGDRWKQHLSAAKRGSPYYFHRAIRKYGESSFKFEIIEECQTIEQLAEREIYWISKMDTYKSGYNCTHGGETGRYDRLSPDILLQITAARVETRSKHWEAISPDGTSIRFVNLRKFCRDNSLETALMHLVVRGKQSHHKGWQCWEIDVNGNRIIREQTIRFKRHCNWIVLSPDGSEIPTNNLKQFCENNELVYKQMHKVATGVRENHRGWRIKARSNV